MTDNQLKQLLAKMLPELIKEDESWSASGLRYKESCKAVLDTELLHLCHLIEDTLSVDNRNSYYYGGLWRGCGQSISGIVHATWQQRTTALAKVKGVEIV